MSTPHQQHLNALYDLKYSYESKGYRFYIEPTGSLLPAGLENFRPDAIAMSDVENVVIEVISSDRKRNKKKIKSLESQFSNIPQGWKLEIFTIEEASETFDLPSSFDLQMVSSQIIELHRKEFIEPTILVCCAAVEAVGRILLSKTIDNFDVRTNSTQILGLLQESGLITLRNEKFLRKIWRERNKYAHGHFKNTNVSEKDVEKIKNIVALLYSEAGFFFES